MRLPEDGVCCRRETQPRRRQGPVQQEEHTPGRNTPRGNVFQPICQRPGFPDVSITGGSLQVPAPASAPGPPGRLRARPSMPRGNLRPLDWKAPELQDLEQSAVGAVGLGGGGWILAPPSLPDPASLSPHSSGCTELVPLGTGPLGSRVCKGGRRAGRLFDKRFEPRTPHSSQWVNEAMLEGQSERSHALLPQGSSQTGARGQPGICGCHPRAC